MERRKKMAPRIDWKEADAKPPWKKNDPTTRSGYSVRDMASVEPHPDFLGGGAKPRIVDDPKADRERLQEQIDRDAKRDQELGDEDDA